MVEVRKRQEKTNLQTVTDLRDNATSYAHQFGVLAWPAFLSLGALPRRPKRFVAHPAWGSPSGWSIAILRVGWGVGL